MTHPFHPWVGREFVFVAIRQAWGEDRVFFFDEDGVAAIVASRVDGRCGAGPVRRAARAGAARSGSRTWWRSVALIDGLRGSVGGERCKANSAAHVRAIMPGVASRSVPRDPGRHAVTPEYDSGY